MIGGNTSDKQPVIFCDFDGTITENDNIVAIMKHFDPPGWEDTVKKVIARDISIREGVGAMFASLPTANKEAIVRFAVDNAKIRSGFAELLAYCKEQDIPFYVTSGGIDFFVYPLLAPYGIDPEHIYCNHSDFSGQMIRILWPNPCDEQCNNDCGMCKPRIIRRFPNNTHHRILIGDSVTDFAGAKLANLVYARSHLLEQCNQEQIACVPYEDFHTIIQDLQGRLTTPAPTTQRRPDSL